jgi:hypothetical protein
VEDVVFLEQLAEINKIQGTRGRSKNNLGIKIIYGEMKSMYPSRAV